MRKSKAGSSSASSAESSSTTSGSSSSVPVSSSGGGGGGGDGGGKHKKSGSSISNSRSTTATINNAKSNTTTTTTATGGNSSSSSGGDVCSINGTRGGSCSNSNDNNSNVQSAGQKQQQQRPPLDRQFDVITDPLVRQFGVATAPLATFDTVDLSDEEVTPTEDTSTTTTTTTSTTTNTNSPGSNNNKTTTTTTIATASTITAARTHEIKTTHTITDTTSCSNSSHVSASSPRSSATNNTNSTTITTTDQNTTPAVTSGKKSDVAHTSSGLNSKATKKKKGNNTICGGGSGKKSSPKQTDATTSSAITNRAESISGRRSFPHPDGIKDSDVTFKQSRVTDFHVIHSSSSDDDEGTSHVAATDLSSASPKCKPDSVSSVEPTRPTIGEGSTATPAAGTTTAEVGGATAGCALLTATVDFANFGSTEDLNSNNIGGSQSLSTVDGGGSTAAPVATGGGAASKPKEVSTVEKASLLDESSSSDSDLSPTEPNPAGGAYTTLTSGSTPNLIRKITHDATSTIRENSGQPMDFNSPELMTSSSKRKAYERRLQRLQVKTTPINRPRSTTPLSVVTLDEYTNLSSPEISPNLEKLKIVLPADQFGRPIKSPRSKENAFDFNEDRLFRHTKEAIVLQSDGSIGQSPRRIFIPPTLSPSQSPCKAAAGSPVSKLVLVSRLPAGTSPLVKSAVPPPVISPPPSSTTTSFSCSTSNSVSSTPAWQTSDKQWEQFDESHSKLPLQQPQATCAVPKRSEPPVALPTFEKKQGALTRAGSFETSSSSKGHKVEQEKKKKKGSIGGEESTKPTFEQQHTDSRRNTTSTTLNPSHHTHRVQMNCPDEEEEIIKIEIGSSEVGKAYNIELEVTAKEKLDSSHSKSSS